jgi:hypothetical protein
VTPSHWAALQHELDLANSAAVQTNNSYLFLREKHKANRAKAIFGQPNRTVVLNTTFRLDCGVAELLVLPFDPSSQSDVVIDTPTSVLRFSGSAGIGEQKISWLYYHLLRQFSTPRRAGDAIMCVTERVKLDADHQSQATKMCIRYIQESAMIGILVDESANNVARVAKNTIKPVA